ncbi:hypothetical protein TNCV_1794441 [Trichonephila clavipes]|nr:hypothetical protein TNCV_1794441 [Trichonephila clavipes]
MLHFIRLNQTKLRAEDYGVLLEDENAQDGMTYERHRGTPDLFITFICNPSWIGQMAADCVDLVARAFQQKVKKMLSRMSKCLEK